MEEAMPPGMFLPRELEIHPSQTDAKRIGIYSKYTIKKGVKYGPYKGVRKKIQDVVTDHKYSWEIVSPSHKPICLIDASDVMRANWLRFVKSARFYEEQNMIATQLKKNIFYKVIKDIYPGDELLCWFNDSGDVSCNHLEGVTGTSKETDVKLNKTDLNRELRDTEEFKQPAEIKPKTKKVSLSKVESNYNRKSNLKVTKRKAVNNLMKNKKVKKDMIPKLEEVMEGDNDVKGETNERSGIHEVKISNVLSAEQGETSEAESTKEANIAVLHDSSMPVLEKNLKSNALRPLEIAKGDLPDTSLTMQLSPPLLSPIEPEALSHTNQNVFDKTDVDLNIQTPDVSSTVTQENVNVFQIGPEDQIRDKRGRPFYKCKVCGGIFSKQVGLKIHYRKNHLARKHYGFNKPVKIAHPREKIRTRSVSVTEVVTKRKQAIRYWDMPYESSSETKEQQEEFYAASDLQASTEIESGSATFTCPYCDKKFRYSGWLERHVLLHNVPSSKHITCQDCPRTFLSASHFRAHLPLHGKVKRMRTKRNSAPKHSLHTQSNNRTETFFEGDGRKVRNKVKKLQCDVCEKRFHSRSNCIRHRRLVHNIRIKRRHKENGQQDYFIDKGTISSKANASRTNNESTSGKAQSKQKTITAIPEDNPSIAAIFGLASSDEGTETFSADDQSNQWIDGAGVCQETYNSKAHLNSYDVLHKVNPAHNVTEISDMMEEANGSNINPKDSITKIAELTHDIVPGAPAMSVQHDNDGTGQCAIASDSTEKLNKSMADESYLRNYLSNQTSLAEKTVPLTTLEQMPDESSTLRRVLSSHCKMHGKKTTGKRVVSSYQSRFYNAVAASPWSQVNTPQPYIPRKKCDTQDNSQALNLAVKDRKKASESVLDLTSTRQSLHTARRGQCMVHPTGISRSFQANRQEKRSNLPPPYATTLFSQRMSMAHLRQQQQIDSWKHRERPLSPSAKVIFPGMNPEHVHSLNSSITKMTSKSLQRNAVGHRESPPNIPHGMQPRYHHPRPPSISPSNPIDLVGNKFYGNSRPSTPATRPRPSHPPFTALNQSTRMHSPRMAHLSGMVPMVPNVHVTYEVPKTSQPKTVKEILEERAASKKHAIDTLQAEPTGHQAPNPQLSSPVSISPHPDQSLPNQSLPNVLESQQPQNLSMTPAAEIEDSSLIASSGNFNKQIPAPPVFGDNSAKISTFKCNVCEAPFNSMKDLTQHVIIHAKEWNYKCEFCIRLFKDPKELVEHRSTLHRVGKMYACSVCQREFAYLSNLQTHQRDCHANVQCSYTELGPDELRPINFTVPVQVSPISPNRDQQAIAKSRISQIADDMKKRSPSKIRNMSQIGHGKELSPSKSPRKSAPVNPQRHHPFAHHRKLGFLNMMTNQRYESVRHDSMNSCTKCHMVFLDKLEFHKHIMECATVTLPSVDLPDEDSSNYAEYKSNTAYKTEDELMTDMKTMANKYDPDQHGKRKSPSEDIHKCFGCGKVFNMVSGLERHKKKCPNQEKMHEIYEQKNTPNTSDQQNLLKEQHSCPFCKRNFCYMKSLKKHAIICPLREYEGLDPLQLIEDAQRKLEETKLKEVSFRKSLHNPFNKPFTSQVSVESDRSSTPEGNLVKIRIRKRSNSGKKPDYVIDNDSNASTTVITENTIKDDDPDKSKTVVEETQGDVLENENKVDEMPESENEKKMVNDPESEGEEASTELVIDLKEQEVS